MSFGSGWLRKGDQASSQSPGATSPINRENIYNHLTGGNDLEGGQTDKKVNKLNDRFYSREALVYLFNEAALYTTVPKMFYANVEKPKNSPLIDADTEPMALPLCTSPMTPENKRLFMHKNLQTRYGQSRSQTYEKDRFVQSSRNRELRPNNYQSRRFSGGNAADEAHGNRRYYENETPAAEAGWHDGRGYVPENAYESTKTSANQTYIRPGFVATQKSENWDADNMARKNHSSSNSVSVSPSAHLEAKPFSNVIPLNVEMSASEKFQAKHRDRDPLPAKTEEKQLFDPFGGQLNNFSSMSLAEQAAAQKGFAHPNMSNQPSAVHKTSETQESHDASMAPFIQAMLQQQQQQQQLAALAAQMQSRGLMGNEDLNSKLMELMKQMASSPVPQAQQALNDWIQFGASQEQLSNDFIAQALASQGARDVNPEFYLQGQPREFKNTEIKQTIPSTNAAVVEQSYAAAQKKSTSNREVKGNMRQLGIRWLYVDTNGNVQGPFTPQNMHEWYIAGYFHPELLIKHEHDDDFQMLTYLEAAFGSERPFLSDAESLHLAIQTQNVNDQAAPVSNKSNTARELYIATDSPLQLAFSRGLGSASTTGLITPFPKKQQLPMETKLEEPTGRSVVEAPKDVENTKTESATVEKVASAPAQSSAKKRAPKKKETDVVKQETSEPDEKPASNPWNIKKDNTKKVSLAEVQAKEEVEAKKLLESKKLASKQRPLLNSSSLVTAKAGSSTAPLSPWGNTFANGPKSPVVSKNRSLADIMKEEEQAQKAQQAKLTAQKSFSSDSSGNSTGSVTPNSAPRGYAGIVAAGANMRPVSATSPSGAKTGNAWAAPFQPVSSAAAVPNAAPKATPSESAPSAGNSWTVVGGNVSAKEKSAPAAAKATVPGLPDPNPHKVAFSQWCKNTLRSSEKLGVKIDEFLSILMSIPLGDMDIIMQICDDALGGLTSIDPRKFAREFVHRQQEMLKAMQQSGPSSKGGSRGKKNADSMAAFDTGNKFAIVGNGSRKKKG